MLFPLSEMMWDVIYHVGDHLLLRESGGEVPKALISCTSLREIKWKDSRCLSLFPFMFEIGKVVTIPPHDVVGASVIAGAVIVGVLSLWYARRIVKVFRKVACHLGSLSGLSSGSWRQVKICISCQLQMS